MAEVETRQQATDTQGGKARFWLEELRRADKREAKWRKEGRAVVKRYRAEKKRRRAFNILWSNTELLKPAILSRTPQPDVRQRHLNSNPVANEAAQILEKALKFTADDPEYDFTGTLQSSRDDMLLPGRGIVRIIYEREIKRRELHRVDDIDEEGNEDNSFISFTLDGQVVEPDEIDEDGNGFRDDITNQEVYCRYVFWEDYREGAARRWDDVPWIAYRHFMTRKELKSQFGEIGILVPLTVTANETGESVKDEQPPENPLKQAVVWEIWDKESKKRIWVAENYAEGLLDTEDDPLQLTGFFPQPDPIYSIKTTDTRVPAPEFRIYKDQADELDDISMRIDRLIKALKVRGVYAAVLKEVADLLNGDENELFPIEDWAALKDRGGLEGAIAWMPIEQIAKVLAGLYQQRNELKQEIFELTGLSDIIRGSTDPRETKGAQQLKANFGTVRLTPRQEPMERFARQIFKLKGEIIAEHFTADHISRMTGEDVPREVMALYRDERLRGFTIDIETDSTVQPDEIKEQASAVEFTKAATEFIAGAAQTSAAQPLLTPMFFEMYKAVARRFKMGRELEDIIEQTAQSITQAAQQPGPDPEAEAAQAEQAREDAKVQAEIQRSIAELQAKIEIMEEESEARIAIKASESAANRQIKISEAV